MSKLTAPKVKAILEEIVNEVGPDHVAPECIIREWDDPAIINDHAHPVCIVGYVLHRFVGDEAFQHVDDGAVREPVDSLGIDATKDALRLLYAAQNYQDGGYVRDKDGNWLAESTTDRRPWGAAVKFAVDNYKKIDVEDIS
jgi:hypothetical protein